MIVSGGPSWLALSVLLHLVAGIWGGGAAAGVEDGGGAQSPIPLTLPLCGEAEVVDMVPRSDWCCDCYNTKESNVSAHWHMWTSKT